MQNKHAWKHRLLTGYRAAVISTLALGLLNLTSCKGSSEAAATKQVQADDKKMEVARPSGVAVGTLKMTATVQSIDAATRTVTLKQADGKIITQKCGKEVINFDQIRVGDELKITVTEEIALSIRKSGEPPNLAVAGTVSLATKGEKPGMTESEVGEITAKVQTVDASNHMLTLIGPLGNVRMFRVDPRVNLEGVRIGDDVIAQFAQSMAILIEKP